MVFMSFQELENEGMDRTHNPEFTAMEIYVAYKDYNWMMEFCEELLEFCSRSMEHQSSIWEP